MYKQKIYIGSNYGSWRDGKKLLVIGHQIHNQDQELVTYAKEGKDWRPLYEKKMLELDSKSDHIELMQEVEHGCCSSSEDDSSRNKIWNKPWEKKGNVRTWTKFGKTIFPLKDFCASNKEHAKLWKQIAYYNYLQYPDVNNAENGMGKDSCEDFYREGKEYFLELLNCPEIKPDLVILWGAHFYKNACEGFQSIKDDRIWKYNDIIIVHIDHPCTASINNNKELIKEAESLCHCR